MHNIKKEIYNGLRRIIIRQSHLRENGSDFFKCLLYLLCSRIIAIFKKCMVKGRTSPSVHSFYISKSFNALYMLGVPSLHHTHADVLLFFIFFIFLLYTTI